jgi:hypothetical protein
MVIFEGIRPRKRIEVVRERVVLPDEVLEVGYVGAIPMPAYALTGFLLRVASDLHAVVEHGVRFVVVLDVEANGVAFACIAHSEEEPLGVSSRIYVILHQQVVFLV